MSETSISRSIDVEGCSVAVFGMPASGKSTLIDSLVKQWLSRDGRLDVVKISDNALLQQLEREGELSIGHTNSDGEGFILTPDVRTEVISATTRDLVRESKQGQLAILELATFDWETVQQCMMFPAERTAYAIHLFCSRATSVERQHVRAASGLFNAVIPDVVIDRFIDSRPPQEWLSSNFDSYWEFNTAQVSVDEIIFAVSGLKDYGAKSGEVRQLYDA